MLHCVTPVQEICFFASVDFTGKYFLSESAMFPDRRRSDSCRKFLGQLFIWLPPPENYKSPSGCCTRCFKCSWNQLIVNISLKNQWWCFCWILLLSPHNAPQSPDRPAAPRLVLMHNQQTIRQVAEITTRSVWQRLQWLLFDIFTFQVSSTIWGAIIGAKKLSSLEIRLIW